jgi:peptide-methionine (S)-S-oxide reductase
MSKIETATLGGGCFWCLEAIFRHVDGVTDVVSGYAGGNCPGTPTYREVCSGKTGHAEVVQITFDSNHISYEALLDIFMTNHNPTVNTYIKGDYGSQYRSIILYKSILQRKIAEKLLQKQQKNFGEKIRTELSELGHFYLAEENHQNYFSKNKEAAYCRGIIAPKLEKLSKELN